MSPIVLVATEDADLSLFLDHVLGRSGFQAVPIAPRIEDLETRVSGAKALLIDSMDIDRALDLCRLARMRRRTAKVAMMALIRAQHVGHYLNFLKAGADECVMRPLSPDLIVSGLRGAIARRAKHSTLPHSHCRPEQIGTAVLDGATRELKGKRGTICLSPTEYRILQRMLAFPGRVVSRGDLIEAAWPPGRFVDDRTVDVHVSKLRKAIQSATGEKVITTIRSHGFIADFRKL